MTRYVLAALRLVHATPTAAGSAGHEAGRTPLNKTFRQDGGADHGCRRQAAQLLPVVLRLATPEHKHLRGGARVQPLRVGSLHEAAGPAAGHRIPAARPANKEV